MSICRRYGPPIRHHTHKLTFIQDLSTSCFHLILHRRNECFREPPVQIVGASLSFSYCILSDSISLPKVGLMPYLICCRSPSLRRLEHLCISSRALRIEHYPMKSLCRGLISLNIASLTYLFQTLSMIDATYSYRKSRRPALLSGLGMTIADQGTSH